MSVSALVSRRIAKATGGRVVLTLADMDGNETFDPAALGTAEEVAEIRVADDAMVSWPGSVLPHNPAGRK